MIRLTIQLTEETRHIPVWITSGAADPCIAFLQEHYPTHRIFAIADERVANAQQAFIQHLEKALPQAFNLITFPEGEQSKSREQKAQLEDALFAAEAGRDSVIMAIGGGVTGDLAGFVAATFLRGVPLVQVPTSLLAQVDSSIGGKVGINHPRGKNLLGAFYQPVAILADVQTLRTLPEEEFINGLAEVIKYAITLSPELGEILFREKERILNRETDVLLKVVELSMAQKIRVVEADEREAGFRSILNFGHTVGHALEALSHYQLKHGFAVAEGMRVALRLSQRLLGYPAPRVEFFENLLDIYGLNTNFRKRFTLDAIWERMLADKKVRQQKPHFTLMKTPTEPALFVPVEKQELSNVL